MASANSLHQPTRREPLQPPSLDLTERLGVIGLRSRVMLHLTVENSQTTAPLPFVVDSGASYTLVSLMLAQNALLAVPPPETEISMPMRTSAGMTSFRVRPGRIRGWWNESLAGYPFDWPVLFRVDAPEDVPSILGLGGVVHTCRWTFDGSYFPESRHGFLTLEDIR